VNNNSELAKVARKATATFPLLRATESHWNRNMVSIGVFCYTADASASLCDQVDRQLFLLIL